MNIYPCLFDKNKPVARIKVAKMPLMPDEALKKFDQRQKMERDLFIRTKDLFKEVR